ncbi:MAG TPA: glycosyltransferase [Flavobacterium sp.]
MGKIKSRLGNKIEQKTPSFSNDNHYDMVVFCHLRWEFVYQRPQHIISRMAQNLKILFVEEPIGFSDENDYDDIITVTDNLHVLQPKVQSIEAISDIIFHYVKSKNIPIGWFYSPSFVSLLSDFNFETIIYDCMDELTMFKGAPAELLVQEKFLISNASIIFTGGKSLYESKKLHHKNVFCFPSSVDQDHFAKALNGIAIPEDIASIPGPIAGYFGVIDERINLELVNETAIANPTISFVMIGPLAKISEHDLPRQKNIYYLGMKSYDVLPAYIKAFDVAIMPFALNDATKFISPTKTLEYIAAGKPIISTAIKDVVRDYSHCVAIVENETDFTKALHNILDKPKNLLLGKEYQEILQKTSWNATANQMKSIIKQSVAI